MRALCLLLAALALAGCQTANYDIGLPQPGDEAWAPTMVEHSASEAIDGSLFASPQMFTLFQDRRAYRVGDILTIVLAERTQSSKRAGTNIDKATGVGLAAPTVGNKTFDDLSASIEGSRNFNGAAATSQPAPP